MTYERSPITIPLLKRLWANLWERGREEIKRLGLTEQQALALFAGYAATGDGGILLADGEPVLVAGVIRAESGSIETFMQASNDFERHYREIVRQMRRFVDKLTEPAYIYSVTVHPKSDRFFKSIGFLPDDSFRERLPSGWTLRRFVRR